MLWVVFNQNGQLINSYNTGNLAEAGTNQFEIFAIFKELEVGGLNSYSGGSIKFYKPDREHTSYLPLAMSATNKTFDGTTNADLTNGTSYNGLYFNFAEYPDNPLLDTTGLWRAVITLFNVNNTSIRNVIGSVTFNVGNGIESLDGHNIELDDLINELLALCETKLNISSPNYVKVDNINETDFSDNDAFNVGDIVINRVDLKVYQLDENKEPVFVYDLGKNDIKVVDELPVDTTGYEEGTVIYNRADRKFYQLNSGDFVVFQTYITLTTSPISQDDYNLILNHPEYPIIYSGYLYWKLRDTGTILEYSVIDLTYVDGNVFTVRKDLIRIQKSTRLFEHLGLNGNGYSQSYINSQLATKQNTLVSGTNIKTINQQSLLGSGNITIQAGGGAWGEITGDIQDQTDLQDELQDIRAEIAGRAQNISISYSQLAPITDEQARLFKKFDNTAFTDLADFNSYVSGLTLANNTFYSTSGFVSIDQSKYIIDLGKKVIKATDIRDYYNVGNSNLFIIEQTYSNGDPLPDRWYAQLAVIDSSNFLLIFNALESKVDVSGLATTGDLSMAQYEIEREIAPEYNPLTSYAVGDKVIYNHKLYTCTTAIATPETWDSTKWSQISVASGFVDLDKAQVISGEKTFAGNIVLEQNSSNRTPDIYFGRNKATFSSYQGGSGTGGYLFSLSYYNGSLPLNSAVRFITNGGFSLYAQGGTNNNLGTSTYAWANLYLSGKAYIGSANVYTNNTNVYFQLTDGTDAYAMFGSAFVGVGGNKNLGTSANKWVDLNLSGTAYIPTVHVENGTKKLEISTDNYNCNFSVDVAGTMTNVWSFGGQAIFPRSSSVDLGTSATNNRWNTVYAKNVNLSGQVIGASNVFNVINANIASGSTLTDEQYNLIINGKPTLINTGSSTRLLLSGAFSTNGLSYIGATFGNGPTTGGNVITLQPYSIVVSTKVITYNNIRFQVNAAANSISLPDTVSIKGKVLPAYPSDTGTFVLKCVDGTLAWTQEWYGTQAQYDILGTYDSNTIYNIIEE